MPTPFLKAIACVGLAAIFITPLAMSIENEPPVSDPNFEKRLVRTAEYAVRPAETLRTVAGVLYGHKTWWPKIVAMNPQLKITNPDQPLTPGTRLHYRAANVGDEYVVQRGDWLIRIVEWKYGSSEVLADLYKENPWIKNPNLIYPGQKVSLLADGTIKNTKSGQVLLTGKGLKPHVNEAAAPALEAAPVPGIAKAAESQQRDLAAQKIEAPREFEPAAFISENKFVFFGFLIGFLLLALVFSQYQKWARSSAQAETSTDSPGLGEGLGFKSWVSKKEAPTRQGPSEAVPAVNRVIQNLAQPRTLTQPKTLTQATAQVRQPQARLQMGGQTALKMQHEPDARFTPDPVKKRPLLKLVHPLEQMEQTRAQSSHTDFAQSGRGPYSAGERSGTMSYHFDPSWVGNSAADIERRPGYLSLLRNFKKRYIK